MLLVRRPLRALLTHSRNGGNHARHARQEQGGRDNARDVSVIARHSSGEDHYGQDASHHQHGNCDGSVLDRLQDTDGVVSHGRPPSTSDVFSDDGRESTEPSALTDDREGFDTDKSFTRRGREGPEFFETSPLWPGRGLRKHHDARLVDLDAASPSPDRDAKSALYYKVIYGMARRMKMRLVRRGATGASIAGFVLGRLGASLDDVVRAATAATDLVAAAVLDAVLDPQPTFGAAATPSRGRAAIPRPGFASGAPIAPRFS
jgi:hypothetical protein